MSTKMSSLPIKKCRTHSVVRWHISSWVHQKSPPQVTKILCFPCCLWKDFWTCVGLFLGGAAPLMLQASCFQANDQFCLLPQSFLMSVWSWVTCDRAPRSLIPFLPESKYVVPADSQGLPHTSEGSRWVFCVCLCVCGQRHHHNPIVIMNILTIIIRDQHKITKPVEVSMDH